MNPDQVFPISQYAQFWIEIPLIYMKGGMIASVNHRSRREEICLNAFSFFDDKGNYKLSPYLDAAYKAANPNQFEKTLLRRTRK
jgi:hypothetical protein